MGKMSSTFWHPCLKQEQERQAQSEEQPEELPQELPREKQHILLDPESSEEEEDTVGNQTVSEDLQKAVLNCYEYMYTSKGLKRGAVLVTSIALKLHRNTFEKIVKRGKVQETVRGQNRKMHRRFAKIKGFWKDLIRQSIYQFYYTKIAPMLDTLLKNEGKVSWNRI